MPVRAKRPCLAASCSGYVTNKGYCDKHQHRVKAADKARGNSHQRGYDHEWRKAREEHLDAEPLCRECDKRRMITPATVVDHIEPHKGNKKLFWDRTNWQSLCYSCHSRKTATEDRGAWNPNKAPAPATEPDEEADPEPEPVNNFVAGDSLTCTNPVIQSRLLCNDATVWTVQGVYCELVEVSDGIWSNIYHFSNFQKIDSVRG